MAVRGVGCGTGLVELDPGFGEGDRQRRRLQGREHLEGCLPVLQARKPAVVPIEPVHGRVRHAEMGTEALQLLGGAAQIGPSRLRGGGVLPVPDGPGRRAVDQVVIERAFGFRIFQIDWQPGPIRGPGEHAEPAFHAAEDRHAVGPVATQAALGVLPCPRQTLDRE